MGRTGEAVLKNIAEMLTTVKDLKWAATGLAAAWQMTRYADFRLTTIFVSRPLFESETLGFRPVLRGENVWLAVPKDDGVLYRAEPVGGAVCVTPVQAYLDLLGHPERSQEAAGHLRAEKLGWRP